MLFSKFLFSRSSWHGAFCAFFLALAGCTKTDVKPVTPATGSYIYVLAAQQGSLRLSKVDAATGFTSWQLPSNSSDALQTAMQYSEGLIFHGSYRGVTAYNTQSASQQWQYIGGFPSTGAHPSKATVIKDSLLFLSGSTDVFYTAPIICFNKFNGSLKWQRIVDSIGYFNGGDFNSFPVLAGGKIAAVTRDYNGHKKISAYRAVDGKLSWQSSVNDDLLSALVADSNQVYGYGTDYLYCYDAGTGQLRWQTSLKIGLSSPAVPVYVFTEGATVVVATPAFKVTVLNKQTGSIISNLSLPVTNGFNGYAYKNNTLFFADFTSETTFRLRAFDVLSTNLKWTFTAPTSTYGGTLPVITDKGLVIALPLKNASDPNMGVQINFIDFSGNLTGKLPVLGDSPTRMLFIDQQNVYAEQVF